MALKNMGRGFFSKIVRKVGYLGLLAGVAIIAMKWKNDIKGGIAKIPAVGDKVNDFIG